MIRAGSRLWSRGAAARALATSAGRLGLPEVPVPSPHVVDAASQAEKLPLVTPSAPVLRDCHLAIPSHRTAVQAWVESLRHYDDRHVGLADLHPDVFAVMPRGPTSYYYMLPMKVRVLGLKVALTTKLMQDNLHIVDGLDMPTCDPQYLADLARYRHWGQSVLIVDVNKMPENIMKAAASLKTITLVPALGLNVHSILKHETLVLTLDTVTFLEEKLLWHDSRYTALYPFRLPYGNSP
ncbi:hypothetical protein KIL84_021219 [Mauremys mutica]|uniref:Large ribosomal subunit protein uL4m n=1 Tax=Mauremys mutica TaxID=74926 RepID=A0A9D3XC28_9SAUR|nr:hypothetical protein KIL84_021219 [Mauremys mutica]